MKTPIRLRSLKTLALSALVAALTSGCYLTKSVNYFSRTGSAPWWCQGAPELPVSECNAFSLQMDAALYRAEPYQLLADATAAGAAAIADKPAGLGHAVALPGALTDFNPTTPNVLLYNGTDPGSRLAGLAWRINSATAPAGFDGDRDAWTRVAASGDWWLAAWVVRGYENHPDVFAVSHPCLADGVELASTADACYLTSHTVPLELMVVNDDGYSAEGIGQLVAALTQDPNDSSDTDFVAGLNVTVVAPLTQQSGQGDTVTPGGAPAADTDKETFDGTPPAGVNTYPVLAAVHGTPADSVNWAVDKLMLSPDLVISGINDGANLANVGSNASGTVGAARTARRRGFDSVATSAEGSNLIAAPIAPDWPAAVTATLAFLEDWRVGKVGLPQMQVPSINIPACSTGGAIRGTIMTVVEQDLTSGNFLKTAADCESTKPEGDIIGDLDAYMNGFVSIADMGKDEPPNW